MEVFNTLSENYTFTADQDADGWLTITLTQVKSGKTKVFRAYKKSLDGHIELMKTMTDDTSKGWFGK